MNCKICKKPIADHDTDMIEDCIISLYREIEMIMKQLHNAKAYRDTEKNALDFLKVSR